MRRFWSIADALDYSAFDGQALYIWPPTRGVKKALASTPGRPKRGRPDVGAVYDMDWRRLLLTAGMLGIPEKRCIGLAENIGETSQRLNVSGNALLRCLWLAEVPPDHWLLEICPLELGHEPRDRYPVAMRTTLAQHGAVSTRNHFCPHYELCLMDALDQEGTYGEDTWACGKTCGHWHEHAPIELAFDLGERTLPESITHGEILELHALLLEREEELLKARTAARAANKEKKDG